MVNKHKAFGEYKSRCFFITKNGGIIMNTSRFTITTIVENGYPHYKIYDNLTHNEIHCDLNELNETIWELLGV